MITWYCQSHPRIWLGVFDCYVGSGLKGLIYMHLHVCFHVCSVLSCYVWMFCMYIVCIYMYVFVYLYVCIYMYVHLRTYILVSMYVLEHTFISIKVICLSCRCLDCYLLVWYCYLGSILAFSLEFQNLNTTIVQNPLINQLR